MELLAFHSCLLAGLMVFLLSYTRRARAQATMHQVGDPAVAHRALIENADDFSNRPAAIFPVSLAIWPNGERNDSITTTNYDPHWRALRCNLTAEILSRLGSLETLQKEAVRALVADVSTAAGGQVAIAGPITAAVFTLASRMCFGDIADDDCIRAMGLVSRDAIVAAEELSPRFNGSTLSKLANWRGFRRISGLVDRQAELYLPLIAARRQSRSPLCGGGVVRPYVDSLLDLRVPEDGGVGHRALRDGELVGLVFEFLGSLSGSTSACVEWTLAHLVDQPEIQSKLRLEIDEVDVLCSKSIRSMPYLNAVVLESLRMHPPVPYILRGAHGEGGAKAIGATGGAVPVHGLRVRFNLGDIGRDKKTWTNPDEFRPERFLAGGEAEDIGAAPGPKEIRMMPFGAGHRHCPGMSMGMLHIKHFVAALVREFEWAPSAEDCRGGVDMTEQNGFIKRMKKPLSARITRRT
ncbi:hypothetical protein ACQ4PT_028672 [Festuca glaucescens]